MKTLTTPKGGQVRVSDEVAVILVPLGYKEPVKVKPEPAPKPTTKRAPRKTASKKEA